MSPIATLRKKLFRHEGEPDLLGSERSFDPPLGNFRHSSPAGYYIDFSLKAADCSWPPHWLAPRNRQIHVATMQWALGCYERYLDDQGHEYLEGALTATDYLCEIQETEGVQRGGWTHLSPLPHTFNLEPPWLSAMAQGEGASLLTRMALATGEERYADAAREALLPLAVPSTAGGTLATVNGRPALEEYPSTPPSFVLNGAIFALWGLRDVGALLGDSEAESRFVELSAALKESLPLFDTGWWSRYDLYPHTVSNIASPAYHLLHIKQLRVMEELTGEPEFALMAARFDAYRQSKLRRSRAIAAKVAFRLLRPRSKRLVRIGRRMRRPGK